MVLMDIQFFAMDKEKKNRSSTKKQFIIRFHEDYGAKIHLWRCNNLILVEERRGLVV